MNSKGSLDRAENEHRVPGERGQGATDAQRQMVDSSIKVLEEQMNAPGATPGIKAQRRSRSTSSGHPHRGRRSVSVNKALYLSVCQGTPGMRPAGVRQYQCAVRSEE